jgi:hypothetical protein
MLNQMPDEKITPKANGRVQSGINHAKGVIAIAMTGGTTTIGQDRLTNSARRRSASSPDHDPAL